MFMEKIKRLLEREKDIIIARFLLGLSLRQIGKECGVSRERIRQICHRTLDKMDLWFPELHWARRRLVGFDIRDLLFLSKELARKNREINTLFPKADYLQALREDVWNMIIRYCSGSPILYSECEIQKQLYLLIQQYEKKKGTWEELLDIIQKKIKEFFVKRDEEYYKRLNQYKEK